MNNFISKILIFILISCSNNSVNNKNESDDNTEKEKISNEINYTDIEFEVNAIPFDIVDIEKNNYTNIDNRVIDRLNAYKTFTNDIVNINGSKYLTTFAKNEIMVNSISVLAYSGETSV